MRLHEETINRMNTRALMALCVSLDTGNTDDKWKNGYVPFENPWNMLVVDADDAWYLMEYAR
jgi:hypothetical protein